LSGLKSWPISEANGRSKSKDNRDGNSKSNGQYGDSGVRRNGESLRSMVAWRDGVAYTG
jgi:hypothetical protein